MANAKSVFEIAGALAGLAFSALYLSVAGSGIYAWGGAGWLVGALAAALFLRLLLPFPVGVFYLASAVWGWHWAFAAILALAGAAAVVPSLGLGLPKWARSLARALLNSGWHGRTPAAGPQPGTH